MSTHLPPPGSLGPDPRDPGAAPDALVAAARILDALADGGVLRGTPAGLTRRLGVGLAELGEAACRLRALGWLAVARESDGRLALRWVAGDR